MQLFDKILTLCPLLTTDDFGMDGTIKLRNDSTGDGEYIAEWSNLQYAKPTKQQLNTVE